MEGKQSLCAEHFTPRLKDIETGVNDASTSIDFHTKLLPLGGTGRNSNDSTGHERHAVG